MLITEIQIRILENTSNKLKGLANIVLDQMIVIKQIKILRRDDGYFLAMPNKPAKEGGFHDLVHPINVEVRKAFETLILDGYEKTKAGGYTTAVFTLTQADKTSLLEQTAGDFSMDGARSNVTNAQEEITVDVPRVTSSKTPKKKIDDNLLKWLES